MRTAKKILAAMLFMVISSNALAQSVSPKDASDKIKAGKAILIDVRELDEVKDGMAQDAYWLPTSDISSEGPRYKDFISKLPKDKEIIVYCAVGGRAGKFAQKLKGMGYQPLNMGGYKDWQKAGLPVKVQANLKEEPCPFLCLSDKPAK